MTSDELMQCLPVCEDCSCSVQVGALASLRSGAVNPHDGRLTFVGRVLASLPVDIRVGKLVMLGHVFGMLDEAIIIGEVINVIVLVVDISACFFVAPSCAIKQADVSFCHPFMCHKVGW